MIFFKNNDETDYPFTIVLKGVPMSIIETLTHLTMIYDSCPKNSLYSCINQDDIAEYTITFDEMEFLTNQLDVLGIKYKKEVE
jgi:hypothetical protein